MQLNVFTDVLKDLDRVMNSGDLEQCYCQRKAFEIAVLFADMGIPFIMSRPFNSRIWECLKARRKWKGIGTEIFRTS